MGRKKKPPSGGGRGSGGRKTKKPNDARGYARGAGGGPRVPPPGAGGPAAGSGSGSSSGNGAPPAPPAPTAPSASRRARGEMRDLLDKFSTHDSAGRESEPGGASSSTAAARPSDRFASRLSNVVDNLDDLGFSSDRVEEVAVALGYELTLEGALDWMCLNLSAAELPPLFTDGTARRELDPEPTEECLTVVRDEAAGGGDGGERSRVDNVLVVESTVDGEAERSRLEAEAREESDRKRWLLRQYEYEEGDDNGNDNDKNNVVVVGNSSSNRNSGNNTGNGNSSNGNQPGSEDAAEDAPTPEELRLVEEERVLAELEADANDDANNYMRSKAEIKELKVQVKKARQRVAGLRRKVERARAERERQSNVDEKADGGDANGNEKPDALVDKEEEDGCGAGTFDLFAKDEAKPKAKETPSAKEAPKPLLDFVVSSKWTGNTPQKKLEEELKRKKLPRARYSKLPRNSGFVLKVSIEVEGPPLTWEAKNADFTKDSSVKDYLAIHALYAMHPTAQLHRIFSPPFRDLWLSWTSEKEQERDDARRAVDEKRKERIDRLMGLIAEASANRPGETIVENDTHNNEDDDLDGGDAVLDDWEDEASDDATPEATAVESAPTDEGERMRAAFERRCRSAPYRKMKAVRDGLPMASYRSALLDAVANNPVTILRAETGAGKSTQCGQYILEQAILGGRGDATNILCTQPRRVAATSLAERVADEMCDRLGKTVGYQIRMESRRSEDTRLLFCTTGVVLRKLRDDPDLTGTTHVLVDEVHERQQQVDVLLVVLRKLLSTTRPDLKVVLMSATMDADLFQGYFGDAPTIDVPGRTYPVARYHLEDLLEATGHVIEEGSRCALREDYRGDGTASLWVTGRGGQRRREVVDLTSQVGPREVSDAYAGYGMVTRRSMERVNEEALNYDLIEDVLKLVTNDEIEQLAAPDGVDMSEGSILIFLPGLGEIKALMDRLEGSRFFRDGRRFELIPLHSTLSSRDQRRAFLPSKPGCRKIICATNIAETSVTIPDVVCVIDSGRVREVRRNRRTSTSMLVTDWCPLSSAKQRQGRAGRVQPGVCLKLYSSGTECLMKATNEPELRRVPLEEICLSILSILSGFSSSCMGFLNEAPQPPTTESVQAALDVLNDVGAIERIAGQDGNAKQSEVLTPLGRHLAKLPVDVRLGKILIFGALFRCIDPVLTIAASLSTKSPFTTFVHDAAVAKAKQATFVDSDSDFMTLVNVWEAYNAVVEKSTSAGKRFCQEYYLNYIALREISEARRQFASLLCGIGFLPESWLASGKGIRVDQNMLKSCQSNRHAKRAEVIHTVICAGLYPNVARLDQGSERDYTMWHKDERIYFHRTSVNGAKKRFPETANWVVFHEKFGSNHRTSVSTTAFIHPFALLLFGGSVLVKHTERIVTVDNWMTIGMPAQTGVILREIRKKVDAFLQLMIECADSNNKVQLDISMIDGILAIIVS